MRLFVSILLLFLISDHARSAEKPNILLICIDDLNTQLACYGHKHIKSPHIDQLASQGRLFKRHYVQAPTCGVSRFSLLSGLYPPSRAGNNLTQSYYNKKAPKPSLPHTFRKAGYTTVSVGKVSHYPGGFGGKNWNDPSKPEIPGAWTRSLMPCGQWKNPQAAMHGYQGGKPRERGKSPAVETTQQSPAYPDDLILTTSIKQIDALVKSEKPWMLAVGFIKPHLPFTAPKKFLTTYDDTTFPPVPSPKKPTGKSLWHRSGEFRQYQGESPDGNLARTLSLRKHYAASTSYVDSNVGKLLDRLKQSTASSNTIIILWSDHGFSLGEKGIWGKHHLYHTALHSPLVIQVPNQHLPGKPSEEIVETIDIYPTLCDLAGIKKPAHLDGKTLVKLLNNPAARSKGFAYSFWGGKKSIITRDKHTIHHQGKPYLQFDLTKDPHEENNLIE